MLRRLRCAVVALALLIAGDNAWGVVQYTVNDLGTLGGSQSGAMAINNRGQVVGWSQYMPYDNVQCAFLYSGGQMTRVPNLGLNSQALDINDQGQIVGASAPYEMPAHAFLFSNGITKDLNTLGGSTSGATGINASGQVIGSSDMSGDLKDHIFLYQNGTMTDLGNPYDLGGHPLCTAFHINASGQAAVNFSGLNAPYHAFVYAQGTFTDIGTLGPNHYQSFAQDINDAGQIVGWSRDTNHSYGFIYQNGVMSHLGSLDNAQTEANAINSLGQVVGSSYVRGSGTHAFVYNGVAMADLNNLIDPTSGWNLTMAYDINNVGQIVGYGTNAAGQTHAFLLTPVPEPSTFALLGMGAIGFLGWAWRRRKTA